MYFGGVPAPNSTIKPRELLVLNPKLTFMDQFHEVMRFHHLALSTEEAARLMIPDLES